MPDNVGRGGPESEGHDTGQREEPSTRKDAQQRGMELLRVLHMGGMA